MQGLLAACYLLTHAKVVAVLVGIFYYYCKCQNSEKANNSTIIKDNVDMTDPLKITWASLAVHWNKVSIYFR